MVAMIYEARPNVTADAAALSIKTGNAVILRGGSMAIESCVTIALRPARAAAGAGLPEHSIQIIASVDREDTDELMTLHGLVDVLIPRGGAGLIRYVVEDASPGDRDRRRQLPRVRRRRPPTSDMALAILVNAKASGPSVCNAAESLLVHERRSPTRSLPAGPGASRAPGVDGRTATSSRARWAPIDVVPATEADWGTEYLSSTSRSPSSADSMTAIAHINEYGTGHTEAIVTDD